MLREYDRHFESADNMRNSVFLDGKAWPTIKRACSDADDFIKWLERYLARNQDLDAHRCQAKPHFQREPFPNILTVRKRVFVYLFL